MGLRVVFAGTPHFALPCLQALLASHTVCAVYTKPDSPSGRGLKLCYSPVKQFIIDNYRDLPILQPVNLKDVDTQRQLSEWHADVMIVIAYGLILPLPILGLFKYGCLNVHASLLPRWRGAAPIQRALLAGDKESGVTVMRIDKGLDTGDMLLTKACPIAVRETAGSLHEKLAHLGVEALTETLQILEFDKLSPKPQDNTYATYAAKLSKDEALINWQLTAVEVDRQIRAFNPWPIAHTYLEGQILKVWEAEILSVDSSSHSAGRIIAATEKGIDVATKSGLIRLLTVQIPGGKPMASRAFLNARSNIIKPLQTQLGLEEC